VVSNEESPTQHAAMIELRSAPLGLILNCIEDRIRRNEPHGAHHFQQVREAHEMEAHGAHHPARILVGISTAPGNHGHKDVTLRSVERVSTHDAQDCTL